MCALALAATPAISAVLLTNPSIAPNVAARSQPPETSECLWSMTCGIPVGSIGGGLSDSVMASIQRQPVDTV